MWLTLYTGRNRDAGINKETRILFETDSGKRMVILESKSVHIRWDKIENNPIGDVFRKIMWQLVSRGRHFLPF